MAASERPPADRRNCEGARMSRALFIVALLLLAGCVVTKQWPG
jgi:hypothetical protein